MRQKARQILEELAPQVQRNCTRADASLAGRFSLCGLLMRLNSLYKWEKNLPPWQVEEPPVLLDWVGRREELWLSCQDQSYEDLVIENRVYDPYDSQAVNQLLRPLGLVYSAGLAGGLTPVFFLGGIKKEQRQNGLECLWIEREQARSLLLLPGLKQGDVVYLREEPLAHLLWDRISDPRKSARAFAWMGLKGYGVNLEEVLAKPSWPMLEPVLQGEMETVLWHELGEAEVDDDANRIFHLVLQSCPASDLELFVRALKDLLADTLPQGRLSRIIAAEKEGALGFYPAWLDGYTRFLFPEISRAVLDFVKSADWQAVEVARDVGLERAADAISSLSFLLVEGVNEKSLARARSEVMEPLTGQL
ncbi:Sfum_1244 family protein [Dethiosulfatarculus sandiegensis]|uniref:Uncharacterized protein n=1 Tax=Dethiosulfatarculus sandiegensis TaxID=1429043 RepID=A0A0D2JDT6_9BACT|nr:Sfum_1244 family protein [Dethiosulfatarculus sandiegensis]KIX13836.1 hypothetical protein X474_11140 [Dethiosulfatarculus sandiegensis]